ncbi:hypothetical protein DFR52_102160 [Hoeflea marina]|uniref:DUF2188 domain-containing protein n=1 Tax=Hoeflea marina TaxID=274592 RepID=A0A317PN64_9HYPH|nr:DUF2188 domain-containing protein [Hoeflea marina]PWW01498.1 hypothetical protein DFR52_102160 [Hoeflea marina]
MTKITYQIVQHDGGFAYKVGDVYSETFSNHDDALRTAREAAGRQRVGGDTAAVAFEDTAGNWHEELIDGRDRPETVVEDNGPSR